MEERMTELSVDEKATRIARSCHAAGVDGIRHWPVTVRESPLRSELPYLACGGMAKRDFGSGEVFIVHCGAELAASTVADLEDAITRHLCAVEHGRDWLRPPPKKPFFSVRLEGAPQVPAPPLAPPEIGA
jgi:hypothetical protein